MVHKLISMILAAVVAIGLGATAQAGVLLVAGSPGYNPDTLTGLKDGTMFVAAGWGVTNSGTAVAQSMSYLSGNNMGARAVRWDYTGAAGVELGNLGLSAGNATSASAFAVNNAGTAVGRSDKYDGSGNSLGYRAVRWDVSGTAATELAPLSLTSAGVSGAEAWAVNAGGMAVGSAAQYDGDTPMGTRPVRWNAAGAITELGNLGLIGNVPLGVALAINDANTAVGWVQKPGTGGISVGKRAVRWDALGAVTELGNLGINSTMFSKTDILAFAVNAAGTAVGWAEKWSLNGKVWFGNRPVRWDASGTAATELGTLGVSGANPPRASGIAYAVNDANTAVGYSEKYDSGTLVGTRAVRWDVSGAATELGNLGLDVNNSTSAIAWAVNGAGTAVGYSQKYDGGIDKGSRAVIWLPDASAIDLNDLGVVPVPAAGSATWTLTAAKALSADGWVAGSGTFDPDGDGPQAGYVRHWVTQVGLGGAWTNAAGGTWGRGPNWSTGTPAMQVGNATFNLGSAYAVALDRDERTKTVAINAGTVKIDFNGHTLTAESGLSIAAGATLKGSGTIVGDIVNAGTLAPGASAGTLSIGTQAAPGSVTMAAGSIYEWEFDGAAGDTIAIVGDLTFDGPWTLKLVDLGGGAPPPGQYNLFTFTGLCSGFVPGAIIYGDTGWPEGAKIELDTTPGAGRVYMNIPEPATLFVMMAAGLPALLKRRRRVRA
jgi:hypothetical protein